MALVGNLTAYRLHFMLRCVTRVDTLRGLADDYEAVVGVKVNRQRLREALEILEKAGDLRCEFRDDGLTVTLHESVRREGEAEEPAAQPAQSPAPQPPMAPESDPHAPPPPSSPPDEELTGERWLNSPEGIEYQKRRQAELDEADRRALEQASPMPEGVRAWVDEQRRARERREAEEKLREIEDDE
jgi:hypothetical protein